MSDIVFDLIDKELHRQQTGIELIASENFTSKNVMRASGSVLTNKYARFKYVAIKDKGGLLILYILREHRGLGNSVPEFFQQSLEQMNC